LPPADGDGAPEERATNVDRGVFGADTVGEPSELNLGEAANERPMRDGESVVAEFLLSGDFGERFASTLKREIAPSDPRHFEGGVGGGWCL
jgi:hypothetical protein